MTFNDNARIDSSRVQRRGRSAGGGIAIGGGVGGIVIALLFLVMQLMGGGGAPSSLDGPGSGTQDQTTNSDFDQRCSSGADANKYSDCRVAGTVGSLDDYWGDALPAVGTTLEYPGVVVFDAQTDTGCGAASSATGPFYCPTDQTIYLDTTFFDELQ